MTRILDQDHERRVVMVNDRRELPNRREYIIRKVRIAGRRMLYVYVHDQRPAEVFLRVKGIDASIERQEAQHPTTAAPAGHPDVAVETGRGRDLITRRNGHGGRGPN